jgi:PAS domain S-box-containing protein
MNKSLRLLIAAVSEEDAEPIVLELKRGGYDVTQERVNNAHAMALALHQESWDLIIANFATPQFDGFDALRLVQEKELDLPFIIVSGNMCEEIVVKAMKAGVNDYILKDNLTRLVPAVECELNEAQARLAFRQAQETLRTSEALYRGLFDHVPIGLYRTTPTGEFLDANQALVDLLAYPNKHTLISMNVIEVYVDPQDRQREIDILARDRVITGSEFQLKRFDGISIWVETTSRAILSADGSILYYEGSIQDITERKKSAQSLMESEERFRRLSQASFEGISITHQGKFIDVNEQFTRMLGYERSELIGRPVQDLVAPESRKLVLQHMESEYELPYEHYAVKKDGTTFLVEVHGKSISYAGGTARVTAVKDITERKQSEEEIRNHLSRLEAIREIELSILTAQSPGDTARTALDRIQELLPYNFGGVVLYDFDTNQVEFLATHTTAENIDSLTARSYTINEFTPYVETLRAGQIYIMPDLDTETDLNLASELIKESGIRSFIDVPLIVRGDLIGSFSVLSDQPNAYEPVHLDIAIEVANALAVSIQQGRLLETEQRRREELETLEQVSNSLRQADTREELFTILLTETRSLFNADSGAILTPSEDRYEYTIVQGPQNIEAFLTHQRFAEDELIETITAQDSVFLPDLPFDKLGIVSAIILPIRFNQHTYGAMVLHWLEHQDFPAEERHMLNTIADMAGIAIERMHILENLEIQVTDRTLELTTLYELTALLAAKGDLIDTLQQTLERLLETINSISGAIHLMDDEHNKLDLVTHQGINSKTESSLKTILPDHILWDQLVEKREPLLLMNIDTQDLITAGIHNPEIKNYIGAPIQSGQETLGIISVFYTSDHDPSLDEISLLNLVTDQVGIAVERTRLREQAEQAAIMTERQRLARELHDAVTQALYSISFLAKASRNFARSGEWEQVEKNLGSLQDTTQQALKEMRLLIYELMPDSIEQQGLENVLRQRLESVEQRAGVEVEFITSGSFNLPTEVQFDIFRIAQESLNNILKHAAATEVKVHLIGSGQGLELTIEDNGAGFDLTGTSGGMGLDSMKDRTDKLGGTLTIRSKPHQGTLVKLTIDEVR